MFLKNSFSIAATTLPNFFVSLPSNFQIIAMTKMVVHILWIDCVEGMMKYDKNGGAYFMD